jgi:hypothetical protein
MVIAIDFDHEIPRDAGEICEVRTDRMLPAEFYAGHSVGAQ